MDLTMMTADELHDLHMKIGTEQFFELIEEAGLTTTDDEEF